MKHYWNGEIDEGFEPKTYTFTFEEKEYSLYSSDGVFSAFKADEGSMILSKVLLEKLSEYLGSMDNTDDFKALDMACGNAIISIILADMIDEYKGDMSDLSDRAIRLSEMNIERFDFAKRLKVFKSDKFDNVMSNYDCIFTNPPIRTGKENVYSIFEESINYLKENGFLFVVIRKSHGAKSAQKNLGEIYGNCEIVKKSKGYYILMSRKE